MHGVQTQGDSRADDVVEGLRLGLGLFQTCLQGASLLHNREHLEFFSAECVFQFGLTDADVYVAVDKIK